MPEGPSIVILKEAVQPFIGCEIIAASGTSKKIDTSQLKGLSIVDFKSWGKHFLICLPQFSIRIHLLMFGSYRINENREGISPRLSLQFSTGVLNFYSCSCITIREPLNSIYDWTSDVMSDSWNSRKALKKLASLLPKTLVCDALLDQQIFSGVGNIIKNEVLFRIRVHPKSKVLKLSVGKRRQLVKEAVLYSYQFLKWKKAFTLRKHWLVHTKKLCPRDSNPIIKEYLGKTNRRSFFCNHCQARYV